MIDEPALSAVITPPGDTVALAGVPDVNVTPCGAPAGSTEVVIVVLSPTAILMVVGDALTLVAAAYGSVGTTLTP